MWKIYEKALFFAQKRARPCVYEINVVSLRAKLREYALT